MTPSYRWTFLGVLALANIVVSVPPPLVTDACSLICNPGAETESDRLRDYRLYPRYPKASCEIQSGNESEQATIILNHCLQLCANELSVSSVGNCAALLSSFGADLGCYCEALSPLSPNTNRLGDQWRLDVLVQFLRLDLFTVILTSPLDSIIMCEIFDELFAGRQEIINQGGRIYDKCEDLRKDSFLPPLTAPLQSTNATTEKAPVKKRDIKSNLMETVVNDNKECTYDKEIILTSEQPSIALESGDNVTFVKRTNEKTAHLQCSVVQAVSSRTPEENELITGVRENIASTQPQDTLPDNLTNNKSSEEIASP